MFIISYTYIYSSLLLQNSSNKTTKFSKILDSIDSGNCALFVDTVSASFDINIKGFKQRSVDTLCYKELLILVKYVEKRIRQVI